MPVDDYTVDVVMDPPDANLVVKMFDRGSIVHNKEHWEAVGPDDHKSNAIATGALQAHPLGCWRNAELGEAS